MIKTLWRWEPSTLKLLILNIPHMLKSFALTKILVKKTCIPRKKNLVLRSADDQSSDFEVNYLLNRNFHNFLKSSRRSNRTSSANPPHGISVATLVTNVYRDRRDKKNRGVYSGYWHVMHIGWYEDLIKDHISSFWYWIGVNLVALER